MLYIYTSACGLWAGTCKLGRVAEQRPLSVKITHLSQQPAGKILTSSLVSHQFPPDCAHSVHSVKDQINPCTALSYSPSELSATVNYPQIANDGILWQPVGFYMAGPDYKSFYEDYGSSGASNFIWDFYKELLVFGSCWKLPVLLCTQCLCLQGRYFLRRQICSCSFETPRERPGAGMAYVQN